MESLISSYEVKKYSPLTMEFQDTQLCVFITNTEFKLFCECFLGLDLYEALLEALTQFDNIPEYDENLIYDEGDEVFFYDQPLVSLIDGNFVGPCDLAADQVWADIEKFDNSCYLKLWNKFLRYYLAFSIAAPASRFATHRGMSFGLVKYSEDFRGQGTGFTSISRNELYEWKQDMLAQAQKILENMWAYVLRDHKKFLENPATGCDWSIIESIVAECSEDCNPIKRRKNKFNFIY